MTAPDAFAGEDRLLEHEARDRLRTERTSRPKKRSVIAAIIG